MAPLSVSRSRSSQPETLGVRSSPIGSNLRETARGTATRHNSEPCWHQAISSSRRGDRRRELVHVMGPEPGCRATEPRVALAVQLVMPVITLACCGLNTCADYPSAPKRARQSINVTTAAGPIGLNLLSANRVTDCGQRATVVSKAIGAGEVEPAYRSVPARG